MIAVELDVLNGTTQTTGTVRVVWQLTHRKSLLPSLTITILYLKLQKNCNISVITRLV
jgi:hypothetical protein